MLHDRSRILEYRLRSAKSQAKSLARAPADDQIQQSAHAKSHLLSLYMLCIYLQHKGGGGLYSRACE